MCLFTSFKQQAFFHSETVHSSVSVNSHDMNNLLIYSLLKPRSNFLIIYDTCQVILKYIIIIIIEPRPWNFPSNDECGENMSACFWCEIYRLLKFLISN